LSSSPSEQKAGTQSFFTHLKDFHEEQNRYLYNVITERVPKKQGIEQKKQSSALASSSSATGREAKYRLMKGQLLKWCKSNPGNKNQTEFADVQNCSSRIVYVAFAFTLNLT